MNDFLIIKTFAGFSIQYGNSIITDQDSRSKKVWTLIEYIIIHHKTELTITSILDLLWSEESSSDSPINALKVCLHRAREILSHLNYPKKNLIILKRNTIYWNHEIPIKLDCEEFDFYCKQATESTISSQEKMDAYENALALYKGDFLPKTSGDDWALPITSYYHTLYITTAQKYLSLLYQNNDFEKMVTYGYQAARIEEYDEKIQYYLILGLYHCGKSQSALAQYDHILKLLYNDFGVNPSDELKNLYLEIIKEDNATQIDLNVIQQALKEKETQSRAYECDYAIFQHLYQIQARSMERTGLIFFLCLITLKQRNHQSKKDPLPEAMDCVANLLALSLRSGDVFSRYSKNQYIVLLPSASYENAKIVGERILRKFNEEKIKSKVEISYLLKCMEPKTFEG